MTVARFEDLQRQVFACHSAGRYEDGLELLNANAHHHPRHAHSITVWKAAFEALTGQPSIAVWTLEEGLAAGYWWADAHLVDDPDFASLRDDADFLRIVAECRARKADAQQHAMPALLVAEPPAGASRAPALVALHGSAWTAASFVRSWKAASRHGWLLAVPQSSQMSGPEHYGWLDRDVAVAEIHRHLETVALMPNVDPARVVLAGFWSGATLACELAAGSARGLIVCGMVLDPNDAAIDARGKELAEASVRVAMFGGRGDPHRSEGLEALAEAIGRHGGHATVDVRDDLAHDFPPDFDEVLPRALDFVSG